MNGTRRCSRAVIWFFSRPEVYLVLLAVLAAAGLTDWLTSPRPAARWAVKDAGDRLFLSGDGRTLLTLTDRLVPSPTEPLTFTLQTPPSPIHLWDVRDGAKKFTLRPDEEPLSRVGFSADARWVAAATPQGRLTVWDTTAGKPGDVLWEGDAVKTPPRRLQFAFSPGPSGLLAFAFAPGGDVCLWDLVAGRKVNPEGAREPFAFSADGSFLATGGDGKQVYLWALSGELKRTAAALGSARPRLLNFSPDGRLLAATNFEDESEVFAIDVWDLPSGAMRTVIPRTRGTPQKPTTARVPTFSSNGRLLLVPGVREESPLWDLSTTPPTSLGDLLVSYSLPGSSGRPELIAGPDPVFSTDGRWVVVGGDELGTWKILDGATLTPRPHPSLEGFPHLSPQGNLVAVQRLRYQEVTAATDRAGNPVASASQPVYSVGLLDAVSGAERGEVPGRFVGFTPDERSLLTAVTDQSPVGGSSDFTIYRWELPLSRPYSMTLGALASVLFVLAVGLRVRKWRRVGPSRARGAAD